MSQQSYRIIPYEADFKYSVAKLLEDLWGSDVEENLRLFEWKYEENPFGRSPLGIVALHDGDAVGFRGYQPYHLATEDGSDEVAILMAGDTCVSPKHRIGGLSVKMGRLAMKEYAGRYSLFMNMSCSASSLPGYKRLGFVPIANKQSLRRISTLGLMKSVWRGRRNGQAEPKIVRCARAGAIEVSDQPRPIQMAELARTHQDSLEKIRLVRDERFFAWRFRNPRRNYAFYYYWLNEQLLAYVAVGMSDIRRTGYILDFARTDDSALEDLLKRIINSKHFGIVYIPDYCLDESLNASFKRLGFGYPKRGFSVQKTRQHPILPVLARPVQDGYSDKDFILNGLDTREIANWSLKPIFSDSA